MQVGSCEAIKPFNFFSLEEFEYQQLISRSHYFVGSFVNRETKLNYVVKQIPYDECTLQILRKMDKLRLNNIIPLLGLCLHRTNIGWKQGQRMRSQTHVKEHISLLLFMQKYEMNLQQYVNSRRKKNQPFSREQISSFLGQMLLVLEKMQNKGLSHRDIKPENILYHKGTYYLCDFDDVLQIKHHQKPVVDLTTVEYSSPEFLKNMRRPKQKYFDPFKLDVYALGLTLLFMCSMGRFSLEERSQYIYQSSEHSHADFIKEERRKWVVKSGEYKGFNAIVKMMLEEDEYKRDDFVCLGVKSKSKGEFQRANSDYNRSEDKSVTSKLSTKKIKKIQRAKRQSELRKKQQKVYGCMAVFLLIFFVLLCVF